MGQRRDPVRTAAVEALRRYALAKADLAAVEREKDEIRRHISAGRWEEPAGAGAAFSDPTAAKVDKLLHLDNETASLRAFCRAVEIALAALSPEELRVVKARHLSSPSVPTWRLAQELFVSRSRLYNIETRALQKLAYLLGLDDSRDLPS